MNWNWSLREELYHAFHRWPMIAAYFIMGCLIGWVISFLFPPYYRAVTQIYVALNPYRTYSDTKFLALTRPKYSNIDDYKDWQMTQLESVIYLDEFMELTLDQLRKQDPSWENSSVEALRQLLEADWRSAGTWSLIASSAEAELAFQASVTWSVIVVERVKSAIEAARQTFMIDQDLKAIADRKLDLSLRLNALDSSKAELEDWKESAKGLPPTQPLEPYIRWQILSQVTRLAEFTPAWTGILEKQPVEDASPGVYVSWIDRILLVIDQEIRLLQEQILSLEKNKAELSKSYNEMSEASLGLSPNLEIESVEKRSPEKVRPTTTFVLIGGTIGFLIWILTQLVMITRKRVYS